MTIKEIEDYINNYRIYPDEYTGRRDRKILHKMSSSYKVKNKMITRLEGRINNNGDFEIVGRFSFPIDKPEEKVEIKDLDMDLIINGYNRLMIDLGYATTIGDNPLTENWNLRDMVSEVEYIRSTYHEIGHDRHKLRVEDPTNWNKHTNRLRRFIRTYKPHIDDLKAYTIHNSKYDN